jgi:hypothetical protein
MWWRQSCASPACNGAPGRPLRLLACLAPRETRYDLEDKARASPANSSPELSKNLGKLRLVTTAASNDVDVYRIMQIVLDPADGERVELGQCLERYEAEGGAATPTSSCGPC